MLTTLRRHWPEYLIEAALLGAFMLSASAFGTLLNHPDSPASRAVSDPVARRALMGCAMGLTTIALVYSPLGKRSGAHMNPSVTLGFLKLGKVAPADAVFYIAAQFTGGVLGMSLAVFLLGGRLASPDVNYVATLPGRWGAGVAFLAELAISFLLMSVVLRVSSEPALARFTGFCAGALVALYITFEDPLSGMSMNAARSFGSALQADLWRGFWVYLTAPALGMLAAAALYARSRRVPPVRCAKLHHENPYRCIFCGANS